MLNESRIDEFWHKIKLIRNLMDEKRMDHLLMTTVVNFYWLTGGKSFVSLADESSVGKILITSGKVRLITTNNEINRLQDEELKDLNLEVIVYQWYESLEEELNNKNIKIVNLDVSFEEELSNLRSLLTELEVKRLRWLGQTSATILETCCRTVAVGDRENEVAGKLNKAFWKEGIEPLVLNIGADDRAYNYRHAIATNKALKKYLACSICVRKWGLHVTLTRLVHFGKPSDELVRKHHAAMVIDSTAILNSQVGSNIHDIVDVMLEKYNSTGYKNEWKMHPIGGLIGFKPREFDVLPGMNYTLQANQAFSWNPTIQGTKSEDTILITSEGIEIVTHSHEFVYQNIKVGNLEIERADMLIRDI